MRITILIIVVLLSCLSCSNNKELNSNAVNIDVVSAYLMDGEVWVKSKQSGEIKITKTNNMIDKIDISPSIRYVAANKIIDYYEQEDNIENPTEYFKEPIYSILIIDLQEKKVISELKSLKEIIHPIGWESNNTYKFGEGSTLDIHSIYIYNPATRETIKNE